MHNYELVIIIIIATFLIWVVWAAVKGPEKKKSKGVPNLQSYPPAPIQRYHTPRPTIETQYGRDLMTAAIEIYKSDANLGVNGATLQASSLVDEVYKDCAEIDEEKREESEKRHREFMEKHLDTSRL